MWEIETETAKFQEKENYY
jgi:hypothetical protein